VAYWSFTPLNSQSRALPRVLPPIAGAEDDQATTRGVHCHAARPTVFYGVDDFASVAAQQSICARTEDAFQSTAFILDWYETRQDPSACLLPQLLRDLAAMQDAIKPWKLWNVSVANLYFPCPASPIAQSRILDRMCIVATGTKWLRSG
jgi:hypothetical protein